MSTEFHARLLGNVFKRMKHALPPLSPSAGWNLNIIAGTLTDILDHEVNLGPGEQCRRGGMSPWLRICRASPEMPAFWLLHQTETTLYLVEATIVWESLSPTAKPNPK